MQAQVSLALLKRNLLSKLNCLLDLYVENILDWNFVKNITIQIDTDASIESLWQTAKPSASPASPFQIDRSSWPSTHRKD